MNHDIKMRSAKLCLDTCLEITLLSTKRNAGTWKVLRKEILFITVFQSHYY